MTLILASGSQTREILLKNAGVPVEAIAPRVDEAAAKAALLAEDHSARDIADALAELKATKISVQTPGALVLGADQTLDFKGQLFDKPKDAKEARAHLKAFSANRHQLHSAAVIAENGRPVFRVVKSVTLHVRPLSDAFIDAYLSQTLPDILSSVGAYHLEGRGAQLFSRVEGDYFSVLGLPLIDVMGYLRERGIIDA